MNNSIKQPAIGDLLDGRFLYIPAYQRGYRWTKKQVGDLLRDLLCFANDKHSDGDFYCLQPIIARPMKSQKQLEGIFKEKWQVAQKKGVWEIIDGQQRLTTIYLIFKYLLNKKGWDEESFMEEEDAELYHIHYATREESEAFLENIETCESQDGMIARNVDFFHIANAYSYIEEWIKEEGRAINERYGIKNSLGNIRDSIFNLLTTKSGLNTCSVQVLWYELEGSDDDNATESSIKEFQKINTGKIRLTDAELIKGLFLQRKNFSQNHSMVRQSEIALEWEFIENTLHNECFWHFLQNKGKEQSNRIDLIFSILFKKNRLEGLEESEWEKELKNIDKQLSDSNSCDVFRYYYNRFEGKSDKELQTEIKVAWEEVMEVFRMLDDWFYVPVLYNYIGLLSQCGEDITLLIMHYRFMPEDSTHQDFEKYLKKRIKSHLGEDRFGNDRKKLDLTYGKHNNVIFRILLAYNICLLNEQNTKFESDSDIYKFPFDVLNNQKWNLEHIDSYHTNSLKRDEDKREWIETAREECGNTLSADEEERLDDYVSRKDYASAMALLKQHVGEVDENNEELKNSIGNLTLLDEETNKSYGNSLFCQKRRIIIGKMKQGVYVPLGTQHVFAKFFDTDSKTNTSWREEDIEKYHSHIFETVKQMFETNG